MVNYQNGKIYKIVNDELNLTYFGSTIQPLSVRFSGHNVTCKANNRNSMLYDSICKDELGWTNWYIELHENFLCKNREELQKQEGTRIREFATLNKYIAGRTEKKQNRKC